MKKRGLMTPAEEPEEEEVQDAETEEAPPEGMDEDNPGDGESRDSAGGEDDSSAAGGEQPNVSPEEQEAYDRFVKNGLSLIAEPKARDAIMKSLQGGGDPVEGLANTAAMVVMRLEDSARDKGIEVTPDIVFHGGVEILEALATVSDKAGIHSFEEKELEQAGYRALDIYQQSRQQDGKLDRQTATRDLAALIAADQQGTLTEAFPELKSLAGKGKEPPPEEETEEEE